MIWLLVGGIPLAVLLITFLVIAAIEAPEFYLIVAVWLLGCGALASVMYGLSQLGFVHG
jgi:hypothetical protein